jgi:hypothetical protein
MIVATAGAFYAVARRLAPPSLAWLPAITYALVPGPWHKAPYALCTAGFLWVLARTLERPSSPRVLVLGHTYRKDGLRWLVFGDPQDVGRSL